MGKIIAIIGPSTAGKNFMADFLMSEYGISYIPSVTTRPPRKGESSTYKHYEKSEFEQFIERGELLEYTIFDDHYYGKLSSDVARHAKKGHCLYTITPDRVKELKSKYQETLTICLHLPEPVHETVERRLTKRGHDTAFIVKRLETVSRDLDLIAELEMLGLLDHHIYTREGDKEFTLTEARRIMASLGL